MINESRFKEIQESIARLEQYITFKDNQHILKEAIYAKNHLLLFITEFTKNE